MPSRNLVNVVIKFVAVRVLGVRLDFVFSFFVTLLRFVSSDPRLIFKLCVGANRQQMCTEFLVSSELGQVETLGLLYHCSYLVRAECTGTERRDTFFNRVNSN